MVEPLASGAGRADRAPWSAARALLWFVPFAIALLLVERWVALSPGFSALPNHLGALAIAFDLVVFAPLVYWWLVVRRAGVSAVTLVPVVSIALMATRALLPAGDRTIVEFARYALVPAEIAFVWWAVRRARAAMARARAEGNDAAASGDIVAHLRVAMRAAFPSRLIADIVTFEFALLYYALASWRTRPHVPAGATPFTTHRTSGVIGLLAMAGVITVVETTVVHVLVARWSATVAWVLTVLSLYGLVWLAGFIQSIRLRPVLLTSRALIVRVGMLTSIEIPFTSIVRVTAAHFPYPDKGTPGYLRAFIGGDPRLLIDLAEPMHADGAYGTSRVVQTIGLYVDDAAALRERLDASIAPAPTA